jgi:hypothetical protein
MTRIPRTTMHIERPRHSPVLETALCLAQLRATDLTLASRVRKRPFHPAASASQTRARVGRRAINSLSRNF